MTTNTAKILTFPNLFPVMVATEPVEVETKPTPKVENGITVFEVGQVYHESSVCDHNCIWNYKVISRTAQMITIQELGKSKQIRRRVSIWNNEEQVKPHGSYSMCAILGANRVGEKRPDYSR